MCKHKLIYCSECDVVKCSKCDKVWGKKEIVKEYINTGAISIPTVFWDQPIIGNPPGSVTISNNSNDLNKYESISKVVF
jgi:hypothetical protein